MPGPKTRSTKKNTAPKGVAPKVPTNENLLFPGIGYPTTQPRNVTVTWPQFGSNPADRGYLEPYDPITGLPTGQTPVSPYIPQFPDFPTYGPPLPPSTTAQPTATPTTPTTGVVDNTNPEMRYFNPYLQTAPEGYAPSMTTGNVPAGGSYADWQEWNRQMKASDPYWNYYNPYNSQYAWQWNPKEPGTLMAGADPRSQEGVPWHEELGIPWSSSYAPEFYSTQPRKPLVGITGGTNRRTMGTRDWRTRNRWEKALEDKRAAGNNNMKTIPAWVGPLVSWRT
jgi:hypothetical protein